VKPCCTEEVLNFGPTLSSNFWPKKSITEIENPPCFPDLAPDDFWQFPKIKFDLKGRKFQDTEETQKEDVNGYSTEVQKMSPTVAASLG
jgi:hypothetical protein